MKKILLIFILSGATNAIAQRVYHIEAMSLTAQLPLVNYGKGKVNVKGTITVTDSTYSYTYKGNTTTYSIIKKVNDNYFKVLDGLKEFFVKIENESPVYKKYTGSIVQQDDKTLIIMWYKN